MSMSPLPLYTRGSGNLTTKRSELKKLRNEKFGYNFNVVVPKSLRVKITFEICGDMSNCPITQYGNFVQLVLLLLIQSSNQIYQLHHHLLSFINYV